MVTSKDKNLLKLILLVQNGFPRAQIPDAHRLTRLLYVVEDILICENSIVILSQLQSAVLEVLGSTKCCTNESTGQGSCLMARVNFRD